MEDFEPRLLLKLDEIDVYLDLEAARAAACLCSSFDLKQFEHRSFFQAFWEKCVHIEEDMMCVHFIDT